MKTEQYIKEAPRTEPIVGDFQIKDSSSQYNSRIIHAIMGLATEAGELIDALKKHVFYGKPIDEKNLIEECGDVMWYLVILCDVYKIDLSFAVNRTIGLREYPKDIEWKNADGEKRIIDSRIFRIPFNIMKTVGEIMDLALKTPLVFNNHGMQMLVYVFVNDLGVLLRAFHSDFETIMGKNIAKLKARFPDKVTLDKASNRDLDKEQQAMDGTAS